MSETYFAHGHHLRRGFMPSGPHLLGNLLASIPWIRPTVRMFGKVVAVPRAEAWYGSAAYEYSGVHHEARPMPEWLDRRRWHVEERAGARFNSVLLNLYRDGRDSVAWHSDDEPELGEEPVIASLSIGASRKFCVREKVGGRRTEVYLEDGDLLVMSGRSQADFQHCLPKTAHKVGPRVNLTFRWVGPR